MNRRQFILSSGGLLIPAMGIAATHPIRSIASPSKGNLIITAAVVSCNTQRDQKTGITNSGFTNIDYTGHGGTFTAAGSYTICKAIVRMSKTGAPGGTVQFSIWSSSGGVPGSEISGTRSVSVSLSTLTTSEADLTLSNASFALTSGTQYCMAILFSQNGTAPNSANVFFYDTVGTPYRLSPDAGATWPDTVADETPKFTLYSS